MEYLVMVGEIQTGKFQVVFCADSYRQAFMYYEHEKGLADKFTDVVLAHNLRTGLGEYES